MDIIRQMFALKPWIHLENRSAVDKYLDQMWLPLMFSSCGLKRRWLSENLRQCFKEYVDMEEQRLKRNLETVRYRIDDLTTLSIVTGPGPIEKVRCILWTLPSTHILLDSTCSPCST